MLITSLRRQLFTPPYPLLPLMVFAYVVLAWLFFPHSVVHDFELSDTDDYMRLNQVIEFMKGAGWYDMSQPRLSPGDHSFMHWARLVDLPIAGLAWPLVPMMGIRSAVMVASLIVPPALLGLLMLPLALSLVRPFVRGNRAAVAAVLLVFASIIIHNFSPGRVDHHGYQIIVAGFGFVCLTRMILCPHSKMPAFYAALAFACGLWIGGEAFPGLILFGACLAVIAAWKGGLVLRNAALFGAALTISTLAVLPLARPPAEWNLLEMTWFSTTYVVFSGLLGMVFVLGFFIDRSFYSNVSKSAGQIPSPLRGGLARGGDGWVQTSIIGGFTKWIGSQFSKLFLWCPPHPSPPRKGAGTLPAFAVTTGCEPLIHKFLRLILIGGLSLCAGIAFFLLVPDAIKGPYANFDISSSSLVLDHVGEAQPLFHTMHLHFYDPMSFWHALPIFLKMLFLPFTGLIVAAWNIMTRRGRQQMLWSLTAIYLLTFTLMTLFWQVRLSAYMAMFTLIPTTWLLWRMWDDIAKRFTNRPRFWLEIAAFGVMGFFPTVLIPAMMGSAPIVPNVALFPATQNKPACSLKAVSAFLNDPIMYGDRPRVIMNTMNEGAELLFRTSHMVLSAPFNAKSNSDSFGFFNARDDKTPQDILKRRHVDLVLLCKSIAPFYAGIDEKSRMTAALSIDAEGNLHMQSNKEHPTLIEKLLNGNIPSWLKPITVPYPQDYLVFEVR